MPHKYPAKVYRIGRIVKVDPPSDSITIAPISPIIAPHRSFSVIEIAIMSGKTRSGTAPSWRNFVNRVVCKRQKNTRRSSQTIPFSMDYPSSEKSSRSPLSLSMNVSFSDTSFVSGRVLFLVSLLFILIKFHWFRRIQSRFLLYILALYFAYSFVFVSRETLSFADLLEFCYHHDVRNFA